MSDCHGSAFEIHLCKMAKNGDEQVTEWKFDDPLYTKFTYMLKAYKQRDLGSEKDSLWKLDIKAVQKNPNLHLSMELNVLKVMLLQTCDMGNMQCPSVFFNGILPREILATTEFASNWNGYVRLLINRCVVVIPQII
jgi:hypothetical protein